MTATAAPPLRHVEPVMGTVVSIVVRAPERTRGEVAARLDQAVGWLHEVDDRFTTYRDSEWLRWCDGRLDPATAHPDLLHVVAMTGRLVEETGGAFRLDANPGRPPDPAAYVKGWAIQRVADELTSAGADAVCVNGGGDIACSAADRPWRVGIQHPHDPDRLAGVVELYRGAVATSGSYERGAHIFDPVTGAPARGFASVTVVGADLGLADAYSTAAFAMGRRGEDWLRELTGFSAFLVDEDGTTTGIRMGRPAAEVAAARS